MWKFVFKGESYLGNSFTDFFSDFLLNNDSLYYSYTFLNSKFDLNILKSLEEILSEGLEDFFGIEYLEEKDILDVYNLDILPESFLELRRSYNNQEQNIGNIFLFLKEKNKITFETFFEVARELEKVLLLEVIKLNLFIERVLGVSFFSTVYKFIEEIPYGLFKGINFVFLIHLLYLTNNKQFIYDAINTYEKIKGFSSLPYSYALLTYLKREYLFYCFREKKTVLDFSDREIESIDPMIFPSHLKELYNFFLEFAQVEKFLYSEMEKEDVF